MSSQDLPPEVIEHVLHRGCAVDRHFCLTLCLVASWTRRLALPYLYSMVMLETQSSILNFDRVITKTKNSSSAVLPARIHVRSLWVEPISNIVVDIFNACENLEYISVHEENLLWLIRAPPRQHASLPSTSFLETATAPNRNLHLWIAKKRSHKWTLYPMKTIITTRPSPFLSYVTHLRLDCSAGYDILQNIKYLVRLTHLAVAYDGSPSQDLEALSQALRAAPVRDICLVLILIVDVLSTAKRAEVLSWSASLHTEGKVHILPSRTGNLRAEWEDEIKKGTNVWRKAELKDQQEITLFGERGR
ncbi:hypothetical protein P691DRAFT_703126 [Macrolepiota fuliginosa MF-IS2]|uniref:Uncharacterized protein n=1 Tax=Macrolepiota fuliginosa MF-IS2 TaxID=1400762 RepID=A0A9P6C2E2_9AGAR|nr:hypothetical protein P691DRAFT_703126 [Macrolepiota fuliginosa MF-IS2]